MITKEMVAAMADELRKTNTEIERLTALRDGLQKVIDNYRGPNGERNVRPSPGYNATISASGIGRQGTGFKSAFDAAIADILRDESALHLKTIFDRLKEQGVFIPGQNPVNNISSHMSNDKEHFENVGKGMWRLKPSPPSLEAGHPTGDGWATDEPTSPAQPEAASGSDETFLSEEFDDVPF